VTPGPAKVELSTYFSRLQISKAEQQNWRGINAHQEIVNFSLERGNTKFQQIHTDV